MDVKQLDAYCEYVRRTGEADVKQLQASADRQIALLRSVLEERIERVQAAKGLFEAGVSIDLPPEVKAFIDSLAAPVAAASGAASEPGSPSKNPTEGSGR